MYLLILKPGDENHWLVLVELLGHWYYLANKATNQYMPVLLGNPLNYGR